MIYARVLTILTLLNNTILKNEYQLNIVLYDIPALSPLFAVDSDGIILRYLYNEIVDKVFYLSLILLVYRNSLPGNDIIRVDENRDFNYCIYYDARL